MAANLNQLYTEINKRGGNLGENLLDSGEEPRNSGESCGN